MEDAGPIERKAAGLAGRGALLVLLGTLVLTAALYARVLDGEFQFDDGRVIERASAIRDLRGMVGEALGSGLIGGERPLTRLTFAVDYAIGGLTPRPFHVTNVLLHLCAVVAVFFLGERVARVAGAAEGRWLGAAAAVAFALHPIQSGAVAYISQRAEVLSSLFYVATLLLLLEAERLGRSVAGAGTLAGAIVAFLLALAAKPIAVTLPAAWLLIKLVLPSRTALPDRRSVLRLAALVAPVFAIAAWYAATMLTSAATGGGRDGGFNVPGLPPAVYALTQLRVLAIYLRLLLFPVGQNVDWDVPLSASLLEPATLAAGALLVALLAGAAWAWWRARRLEGSEAGLTRLAVFGLLWFFVLLAPTSSFVPLVDVLVEHRLYLASWGIFVSVVALSARALGALDVERARQVGFAVGAAGAVLMGAALFQRNAAWATRYGLWSDAAAKSPAKARPWSQLAFAYQEAGRIDDAVQAYRGALARLRPFDLEMELQVRRNFSVLLASVGRPGEAVTVLQRATELAPGNAEIATNMGFAFLQGGDLDGAGRWIDRALALDPSLPEANGLRGSVLLRRGDAAGAAVAFEAALRLAPDSGANAFNLGVALERLGRTPEACATWRRAEQLRGDPVLAARVTQRIASRCR